VNEVRRGNLITSVLDVGRVFGRGKHRTSNAEKTKAGTLSSAGLYGGKFTETY